MSVHTDLQMLYLTVYNRPADWEGLLYWAERLEADGIEAVNQAFTQAPEFEALYAGQSAQQQVNTLYQHLLGREAEAEGLAYWAAQLDEGVSIAQVAGFIAVAAEGDDAIAFEARIDEALSQTYGELLDTLYVGYYGRAADEEGKAYWVEAMKSADGELGPIIEAFGNSDEYVEQYGGMETEAQIAALYRNLFNRDPEPEGAAYWAEQLDSGILTLSSLAFTLSQAAADDDKQALDGNIQALNEPEPTPEPTPENDVGSGIVVELEKGTLVYEFEKASVLQGDTSLVLLTQADTLDLRAAVNELEVTATQNFGSIITFSLDGEEEHERLDLVRIDLVGDSLTRDYAEQVGYTTGFLDFALFNDELILPEVIGVAPEGFGPDTLFYNQDELYQYFGYDWQWEMQGNETLSRSDGKDFTASIELLDTLGISNLEEMFSSVLG